MGKRKTEEVGLVNEGDKKIINTSLTAGNPPLLYHWHNANDSGANLGEKLANAGFPVILSHVTHLYFDMASNYKQKLIKNLIVPEIVQKDHL